VKVFIVLKTDKCGIQKNTDHMMMRIKGKEFPKGVNKTYTPESPWHAPPLIICDLLWVGVTLEIVLWYV